jgi:hypothetical protein
MPLGSWRSMLARVSSVVPSRSRASFLEMMPRSRAAIVDHR